DAADQRGGRDVEGRVDGAGLGGGEGELGDVAGWRQAAHVADLGGAAVFDRDRGAVRAGEVQRRVRRGDVEGHARGPRGERLQIRAYLVRAVAVGGDAVGADRKSTRLNSS